MMNDHRFNFFNNLKTHPWYSKYIPKLKENEIIFIREFIESNNQLNRDEFQYKINRLFIDDKIKPKNHPLITELLTVANG